MSGFIHGLELGMIIDGSINGLAYKKTQYLLFYTRADEASGRFASIKHKYFVDTALMSFILKPDWGNSCKGVCGS